MIVSILGKRWKLSFRPLRDCRGICDAPTAPRKAIRIDTRLKDEERLEVIIHECLHAADWTKDEEFIEAEARDIAKILWRLGYRKQGE